MCVTIRMMMLSMGIAALMVLGAAGCERSESIDPAPRASASALPTGLFLDAAPEGAQAIQAARQSARAGEELVVRGRVAGHADPIAPNRAILTLLDTSIKTCDETPGDSCQTPWDACCEPRDSLQAGVATIQVVDESGRPLEATLRGAGGIEPLKELTVTGTVAAHDGSILVINATGIHVKS